LEILAVDQHTVGFGVEVAESRQQAGREVGGEVAGVDQGATRLNDTLGERYGGGRLRP
jgi:hypothetical protein